MAGSLPFNERLKTASIPKGFELKASLWGRYSPCSFTVINFRDENIHEIEVVVTEISKVLYQPNNVWHQEFRVKGTIVKIDSKTWGSPANQFDALYTEDKPSLSSIEILTSGDPLP